MGDDDENDVAEQVVERAPEETLVTADVSHLYSMDGCLRSKSITLDGSIGSAKVNVLVDTEATHDFIHPQVAEHLHLPLTAVPPFRVFVGSEKCLMCTHVSKQTELSL